MLLRIMTMFFFFFSTAVHAQGFGLFTFEYEGNKYVHYKGDMTEQGISMLAGIILQTKSTHLSMDSRGGDLGAALLLNKLIKARDMSVLVDKDSICASACAYGIMSSNNIVHEGTGFYFHRKYYPVWNHDLPLREMTNRAEDDLLDVIELFMDNGYRYEFLEAIWTNTINGKYLVITAENLRKARGGFLEKEINFAETYTIIE